MLASTLIQQLSKRLADRQQDREVIATFDEGDGGVMDFEILETEACDEPLADPPVDPVYLLQLKRIR